MRKILLKSFAGMIMIFGLFCSVDMFAQSKITVSGVVRDTNAEPLVGVSIQENGSSKSESEYLRMFQKKTGMNGFNGATWKMAHYLNPIAVNHLLITSESGTDASASVIYQNPYWPLAADQSATK